MTTLSIRGTAISALLLIGLSLTGCSAAASSGESAGSAPPAVRTPTPAPAPDLTGSWKQTNSKSKDSYQTAVVRGDSIEVDWVADGGDTTSLYWAGSFQAPTKAGDFSWKSTNDTAKTSKSMLASPDKTKAFTYSNGEISYKVSLMGTTTTVRLAKK